MTEPIEGVKTALRNLAVDIESKIIKIALILGFDTDEIFINPKVAIHLYEIECQSQYGGRLFFIATLKAKEIINHYLAYYGRELIGKEEVDVSLTFPEVGIGAHFCFKPDLPTGVNIYTGARQKKLNLPDIHSMDAYFKGIGANEKQLHQWRSRVEQAIAIGYLGNGADQGKESEAKGPVQATEVPKKKTVKPHGLLNLVSNLFDEKGIEQWKAVVAERLMFDEAAMGGYKFQVSLQVPSAQDLEALTTDWDFDLVSDFIHLVKQKYGKSNYDRKLIAEGAVFLNDLIRRLIVKIYNQKPSLIYDLPAWVILTHAPDFAAEECSVFNHLVDN